MKSKVILFCVLLFCSKIVDSIPHSEDHVRQRVNPLSNWQVNQNAPNAQYIDTDFTQTRNVNIQPEKTQDFYSNQRRRHNYDSNVYNRSPASSPSREDLLVSYDSPADGLGLDSYPSRVESYPSRTSQVGFDNQQYRNLNWRPQNQYTKLAPNAVLIPDDERSLVTTVQEPYRFPVQYLHPKYVPPTNRRFYQPGRTYLTREQVQYPLTGDRKYVANSAPRFGSSGPVPYENYGEDQVAASEIKARPTEGRRYAQIIVPQSEIIYNEAPAVIVADTLTDQSENIEFEENYRSRSVSSNSASITNQDIRSPLVSEPDNNSDSKPSLAHINIDTKKDAPVFKILSEKPLARRYAKNYRSDFRWSNIVGDDSSNGVPVVNEPVEVKSEKYEANYGPKEPVPINTYSGAPSASSDTVLVNSGNNKREESNVAHHGSSSPTSTNTNPKQNFYPTISSEGITEYNLNSFITKPEIQKILAKTNKRYVVVHSNGTVEFLDTIDLGSPQNSKLRLVHHKRKNIGGSDSDGVLTQQSPQNLNNIAKTPLSVDEYPLPTNNQPADDKKPSPLNVDQAKPTDEYDSNQSPPLKDLTANHSNLKPSPQPENQPADNNNYKPSSSSLNEYQSTQNDNLKHLPQRVNQPRDDDNSKTLTLHINQSAGDGNSKTLPQVGNKPVDQKNLSANDDNLKPLTSKEDQPADDYNSKLDQTKDENNFTPLVPNARQPAHVKKPKNSYVKHPANDNNSEPLPANENQPQDDKPFHPYRRQPAHHQKSKHSDVNQPADNNSNPSFPTESQPANDRNSWPSNEDQSGGETDSTSLLPHKKYPVHRYKTISRHSHYQSADDNPATTPKVLTYPENQPGGDKKSNPSSPGESQPANDRNSWPSNEDQSGGENDSTSLLPHKKYPVHRYKTISRHSHYQSADDNPATTPKVLTYPENQPGGDKKSNPSSPGESQPANDKNSWPSNEDQSGGETDSTSLLPHKKYPVHRYKTISRHSHYQSADDNPATTPKVLTYPENQPGGDKKSNPSSPGKSQPANDRNSWPSNEDQSGGETDSTSLLPHKKYPVHRYKTISRHSHYQSADDNPATTPKVLTYPENQPGGDKKSNPSSPNENAPGNNNNSKSLPSNQHQSGDETDFTSLPSHKKQPSHHYKPNSRQSHDQPADDNPSNTPKLLTYPKNQPGGDKNSNPSSPKENAPENNDISKPLPSNEHRSDDETDSISLASHKKQPSHHYKPNSRQSHDQPADDNPSNTPKLLTYPKNQPGDDKNSNPSSPNKNAPENNDNSKPLPSNEHRSGDETDSISLASHKKQPSHHYKPNSRQSHDQPADDNPSNTPKSLTYPKNQPGDDKNSNPSSPNENAPENNDNSKPLPSNEHRSGDETDSISLASHKKQPSHHYKPNSRQSHDQPADDNPSNTPKSLTYPKNQPGDDKNSNPSSPNENAPENNDNSKPLPSNEHRSGDETDSISLASHKKQPSHHYKPNSRQSHDQPADDNPSNTPKLLTYPKNQPGGDKNSNPSSPKENAPENNDNSKPLPSNEHRSGDETDSISLASHKKQPSHHYKPNSRQSHDQPADDNPSNTPKLLTYPKNQPGDDKNSNPSSPNKNAPENNDNSKPLLSNEHRSGDETDSISLASHKKQPSHHYKPNSRQSHDKPADDNPSNTPKLLTYPKNQPGGDKNSNPSSPKENAPENNDNSKPLPSNEHRSGDETDSISLASHKKQPSHHYKPNSRQSHDQPADDNPSNTPKLLTYPKNQPGGDKNSNPSSPKENAPENNDNSKPLPSNEHRSGDETDSISLASHKKQPSHHYKPNSRQSHDQPADANNSNPSTTPLLNYPENQPGDYDNSNQSSPNEDQTEDDNTSKPLPSNGNQSGDGNDSESFRPNKRQPAHHNKSKHSHVSQSANDNEEQPGNDNDSEPLPAHATQSANNTKSKPSYGAQPGNDNNSNPSSAHKNQPEEDKKSKPLRPNENQPIDDSKTKPISADARRNDDQSNSTTVSPTEPNYTTSSKPQVIKTHKRKHIHRTSTNDSPVVSTTPCPDDTSEDQIITLSPIEQTTDNVSDVLPVATTTTTTRPVKNPGKSDNSANNKQDDAHDDTAQTYSTTTVSPSTSTSPTDTISDDKTKGNKENEHTQTKDKTDVDHVNNREKDTQTVATTTTTTRPVKTPGKSDNDANNKQDDAQDDKAQTYSTTTVSSSTSTSPTDNISDDKTKRTKENEHTQTKDKTDVDHVNNREKDTQTVATTTTTTRPVKTPDKSDNDANNKQDDAQGEIVQTYSTTTVSPSTSPNDNISDDKTKITKENEHTQTNDKTDVDHVNNREKDTQTVATTTTTTRPVETPGKSDNDANNKQDDAQDDKAQTYSTTTVSSSTSTSPTDNISDDKTKRTKENEHTQTKDKTDVDHLSNREKDTQTVATTTTTTRPVKTPGKSDNDANNKQNDAQDDKAQTYSTTTVSSSTSTSPTDNISDDKTKITKENEHTQTKDKTDVNHVNNRETDTQTVATTTTTTRPVKTPGKSDNDANNKQGDAQDDKAQTYSTTTVTSSTSTSPTDNISDDKTKRTKENEHTQIKDKTDVDHGNNRETDTQIAVNNSSELFDTNTDVPAESGDCLSVTASPSVQIDVTGDDASGDNSLQLEQSDTDVTITVSSSTANDSEDEIITINIEVPESTDDADSSSTDKSLVLSIDTNDDDDDDSKTPKPEDCKKDHNNDGTGKNVEIDMSNLKGEPTMWIRTTNQDFIDKLTAKNDTEFDLIYFFHIDNQPAIEREKTTTIHCNGTVVTEIIEITYANKDDLTPTIVKTTKIMDLEDYKADEV